MQPQSPPERKQTSPDAVVSPASKNAYAAPQEASSANAVEAVIFNWRARVLSALTRKSKGVLIHATPRTNIKRGGEGAGDPQDEPYLSRFSLYRSQRFCVTLQQILGQPSGQYHDHTRRLISFVICGSYRERYLSADLNECERTVRWFNIQRPSRFHTRISAEPGTWVLVFGGQKSKARGFLCGLVGDQAEYVVPNPMQAVGGTQEDEKLVV